MRTIPLPVTDRITSGVTCRPASRYIESSAAEQAEVLRQAIGNYRRLKKLLRGWETETERLIDAAGSHIS